MNPMPLAWTLIKFLIFLGPGAERHRCAQLAQKRVRSDGEPTLDCVERRGERPHAVVKKSKGYNKMGPIGTSNSVRLPEFEAKLEESPGLMMEMGEILIGNQTGFERIIVTTGTGSLLVLARTVVRFAVTVVIVVVMVVGFAATAEEQAAGNKGHRDELE